MTDPERAHIAESLLALAFSLRPDDGVVGQAWVMGLATTVLARAVLSSVGPAGDPAPIVELAREQALKQITETQSQFYRDKLTLKGRS